MKHPGGESTSNPQRLGGTGSDSPDREQSLSGSALHTTPGMADGAAVTGEGVPALSAGAGERTRLLPGATGKDQSRSYAFLSLVPDPPPSPAQERNDVHSGVLLVLTYTSKRTVQLPLALHTPDGTLFGTAVTEPGKGPARHVHRFTLPDKRVSGTGAWKLVLHKRILTEELDIHASLSVYDPPQEKSDPEAAFAPDRETGIRTAAGFGFERDVPVSTPGWYSGELHLHSDWSTGRTDVATIRRIARDLDLDFLALTDHFTQSHWRGIEEGWIEGEKPLFIRSVEVAGDRGHANLHGLAAWPDPFPDDDGAVASFLGHSVADSMEAAADAVHRQGGLFSINHPLSAGVSWRYEEFPLGKADLIEVVSMPDGPVSFLYPTLWDRLLCSGLHPTGVGSSDSHDPAHKGPWALGRVRTWVRATSLSREGILAGLASGEVYVAIKGPEAAGEPRITRGANARKGPQLLFRASNSGEPGMEYHMGSTVRLSRSRSDVCSLEIFLGFHPSGNLFVMKDGFLVTVQYLPASDGDPESAIPFRWEVKANEVSGTGSHVRIEFHEDLEKAAYHGMAYRDHRSLRLLSNPVYLEAQA